jgi:alpha-1,3-glucosyltransferase
VRLVLQWQHLLFAGSCLGMPALHVAREVVVPPPNLLWIYDRAFITYAFVHFAAAFAFIQTLQWVSGMDPTAKSKHM